MMNKANDWMNRHTVATVLAFVFVAFGVVAAVQGRGGYGVFFGLVAAACVWYPTQCDRDRERRVRHDPDPGHRP